MLLKNLDLLKITIKSYKFIVRYVGGRILITLEKLQKLIPTGTSKVSGWQVFSAFEILETLVIIVLFCTKTKLPRGVWLAHFVCFWILLLL